MRPLVSFGETFGCTLATSPLLARLSTAALMDVRVQVPAAKCAARTGSAGSIGAVLASGSLWRHQMSCRASLASGGEEAYCIGSGAGLALLFGRCAVASGSPGGRARLGVVLPGLVLPLLVAGSWAVRDPWWVGALVPLAPVALSSFSRVASRSARRLALLFVASLRLAAILALCSSVRGVGRTALLPCSWPCCWVSVGTL